MKMQYKRPLFAMSCIGGFIAAVTFEVVSGRSVAGLLFRISRKAVWKAVKYGVGSLSCMAVLAYGIKRWF